MINKISRIDAIKSKLQHEGKTLKLNKPEHIAALGKMNTQLEATRRAYLIKDRESQRAAAKVVLSA